MPQATVTPKYHNPEEFWMQVDRIMIEKLTAIQRLGEAWQFTAPESMLREERVRRVDETKAALLNELDEAIRGIELVGYPNDALKGRFLRDIVRIGDVRLHDIREAISVVHHHFHPVKGKVLK